MISNLEFGVFALKKKYILFTVLALALIALVVYSQVNFNAASQDAFEKIGLPELRHTYTSVERNKHEILTTMAFSKETFPALKSAVRESSGWLDEPFSEDSAPSSLLTVSNGDFQVFHGIPIDSKIKKGRWLFIDRGSSADSLHFTYAVLDMEGYSLYVYTIDQ